MKLCAAIGFTVYLMAAPQATLAAARDAMALWARAVAPALFPFMALLSVFTGPEAQAFYRMLARRPMRRLFRLPPEAAAAVAVGWIAGSPAGALAVVRTARGNALTRRQALTAGVLASGCGPVFLVSSVGAGMFHDPLLGVRLLLCGWLALNAAGLLAAHLPMKAEKLAEESGRTQNETPNAVREAVLGVLTVGGWMTLFAVLGSALPQAVRPFLEISAGCAEAARTGRGIMAAFLCGFGGVCAFCQNYDALKSCGVPLARFLSLKLLAGALSAGVYAAMEDLPLTQVHWRPDPLQTAAVVALAAALMLLLPMGLRRQHSNKGKLQQ